MCVSSQSEMRNIMIARIMDNEDSMHQELTLLMLIMSCTVLANSADPDQLASEGSGSALFVIKYVNFCQKLGSSNLMAGN